MSKPKVSIVCISYNQENYIGQALEGFVSQKTDFDFEIVIADDCSTDKTADIIKKYAEKHGDIFKPILRNKNVGIQQNLYDALRAAKGEYIALCEGDDFWTDPKKLQIQADFMDKHPDYALCFHPVKVFFEKVKKEDYIFPKIADYGEFTLEKLLKENFIQTNSVMYRKQSYESMPDGILPLDLYLHLYHAQFGKIGFVDKVMSAYRRHPGGVWWDSHGDEKEFWKKHGISHLKLYTALLEIYGQNQKYRQIIIGEAVMAIRHTFESDDSKDKVIAGKLVVGFPELTKQALLNSYRDNEAKQELLTQKDEYIAEYTKEVEKAVEELKRDREQILQSLTFRTGMTVLAPPRKLNRYKRSLAGKLKSSKRADKGKNK